MNKATITVQKEFSAVPLSSPEHGELAIVNMDILRELLNANAARMSLSALREKAIVALRHCSTMEEYRDILAYDLAMLQLNDKFREYDEARFKKAEEEAETSAVEEERVHSLKS